MESSYEFKIGQRVKAFDHVFDIMLYGTVDDKTSDKVFIKFDGTEDVLEYERFQFEFLMLSNK